MDLPTNKTLILAGDTLVRQYAVDPYWVGSFEDDISELGIRATWLSIEENEYCNRADFQFEELAFWMEDTVKSRDVISAKLDTMAKRHIPMLAFRNQQVCRGCAYPWPCDASTLYTITTAIYKRHRKDVVGGATVCVTCPGKPKWPCEDVAIVERNLLGD